MVDLDQRVIMLDVVVVWVIRCCNLSHQQRLEQVRVSVCVLQQECWIGSRANYPFNLNYQFRKTNTVEATGTEPTRVRSTHSKNLSLD